MSASDKAGSKGGLKSVFKKSVKRSGTSKSSWRSSAKKATSSASASASAAVESSGGQQSFTLKPSGSQPFSGDEETYSSVGSNGESVSYKSESNSQSYTASTGGGNTEWKLYKETDGVLKYKPQSAQNGFQNDSEDSEIEEIEPVEKPPLAPHPSVAKADTEEQGQGFRDVEEKLSKAQAQVTNVESVNASLSQEVRSLKQQLSTQKASHAAEKTDLQKSLDESLGKMEVLRGERDGLKVKLKALKDTLSGLRSQVDTLIASNAGGKVHSANEGEMLRKEITDLKSAEVGLKEKNAELTNQVASLSKVSSFWESRATVLEDTKKRLDAEIASLQKERDVSYKEKLELAEKKVNDLQQEYKRDLMSVKKDSKEDVKRKEMQQEIERKVSDIKMINKRFEQIKRENDNLRARITHLETTTCSLSDLNASKAEKAALIEQVSALQLKVSTLTKQKEELSERIANMNRKKIPTQPAVEQEDNPKGASSKGSPRGRKGSFSSSKGNEEVPESALLQLRLLQSQKETAKLRKDLADASSLQMKYLAELADLRDRAEGFARVETQMKEDFERMKAEFQKDKEAEIQEILSNQKVVMEKLMEAVIYEEELKRKELLFTGKKPQLNGTGESDTKAKSKAKSKAKAKGKGKKGQGSPDSN